MTIAARLAPTRSPLLAALALAAASPCLARQDAPAPLPSDPVFEAIATDGAAIAGRIRAMSPEGRLELVDEHGDDRTVEAGSLVKLSRKSRAPAPAAPDAPLVVLPGGDQIRGQVDAADEQSLTARSAILGELSIPLDSVLGFSITPDRDFRAEAETARALRGDSRASDRLFLANGDERDVTFSSLGESEVAYLDADRSLKLPRAMVRAVGLDPGLVRAPEIAGPSFDLILTDGSRLRLLEPSVGGGRIAGSTPFGLRVDAPLDRVATLYAVGGPIAYLSDLEPAREVTVPYVGPSRTARSDASVLGDPITVGGLSYARGLGTQSRSLLAYRLGPDDRRFQASVALDDAAGPLGNVVFRVLVDGEQRYASPPVASGDPPAPVDVDVSGGQFLILATEFGRGGGVRDYAAWIEARLIRATDAPPTDPGPPVAGN